MKMAKLKFEQERKSCRPCNNIACYCLDDSFDQHCRQMIGNVPGVQICQQYIPLMELTELEESKLLLAAQKAQTDRHKQLLLDVLGVIVTCRKHNQDEWMRGIVNDINKALDSIGDDSIFEWNKSQDIIRRVNVRREGGE